MFASTLLIANSVNAKFTEPSSYQNPATTVTLGAWPYKTNAWNDTATFQKAIDYVAENGGGKVIVPADTYRLVEVFLKSDVHIVFEGKSTLYPHHQGIADDDTANLFQAVVLHEIIRHPNAVCAPHQSSSAMAADEQQRRERGGEEGPVIELIRENPRCP